MNTTKVIVQVLCGKTRLPWLGGLFWVFLLAVAVGYSQEPPSPSAMQGKGCLDLGCHDSLQSKSSIHGPVAKGLCAPCHAQLEPGVHEFRYTYPIKKLCSVCHETPMKNYPHKPVRDGNCVGCHDPHQSDYRYMLRADPAQSLCLNCHQEDAFMQRAHLHGPAATGACILCHESHSSWNPKLLVQQGRSLCLHCHEEVEHQIEDARHVHSPVQGDCTRCHDPHGSDHPHLIPTRKPDLCLGCHESIQKRIEDNPYVHGAVTQQDGCGNCHSGHASLLPRLLKQSLLDSCLGCHNKPISTPDGRTLTDMLTLLKENPNQHGPVRRADCSACHNPHAASEPQLLYQKYPKVFYAPFSIEQYALCFQCHISEMVTVPTGQGMTLFADGEKNLHYVHVNKERRGRTCRACHEVHASKNPAHIRDSVPYGAGGWEYKINFKQTAQGGSCTPGCHKEKTYVRSAPEVILPAPLEAIPGTDTSKPR